MSLINEERGRGEGGERGRRGREERERERERGEREVTPEIVHIQHVCFVVLDDAVEDVKHLVNSVVRCVVHHVHPPPSKLTNEWGEKREWEKEREQENMGERGE